jgi:hypothetical protein
MKKMIWGAIACFSLAACSNGRNHNDPYENGMDRTLEDTGMYRTDSPDAANQPGAMSRNAVDSGANTNNNSTNDLNR